MIIIKNVKIKNILNVRKWIKKVAVNGTTKILIFSVKNLTLKFKNEIVGEIPIEVLASKAPMYDRKWVKKKLNHKKIDIKKGVIAPFFCDVFTVLITEALRQRCHR